VGVIVEYGLPAFLFIVAGSAMATAGNVQFVGKVSHTCSITVDQNGTLGVRSDFTRMNSRKWGGTSGHATITASASGLTASVDDPASFSIEPAADTTPEIFRARHAGSGATSYGRTRWAKSLNIGVTNVVVDLVVRKSGSDIFEAGDYQATVVLRCE